MSDLSGSGPAARRSVQDAYDRWAETYETDDNPTRDLSVQVLRSWCTDLEGARVLEIGCGTGLNMSWLAERAACVTGIDLSAQMLAHARRQAGPSNVRFIQHDITRRWPLEDGSAEVVVSALVLEHVEDLAFIFREMRRVLSEGGEVVLSELHPFRQLRGTTARFEDAESGAVCRVPAFYHSVSSFTTSALEVGLELTGIAEPRAEGDTLPRLLVLRFGGDPARSKGA